VADGYFVGINWNRDGIEEGGDFSDVGEDVTEDVLANDPVQFQYGRDTARALSPPRVGSIGFSLCNTEGLYLPTNPSSPIAPNVAPGAQIKVTETIGGTEYGLMRGRLDTFDLTSTRRDRSVQITGLDDLSLLRGKKITLPMYRSERTGRLIVAILDAVGWFSAGRDVDFGASFLPYFWATNEDAFDLVTRLLRAEGPPAVAYVDPNGNFVFRDRHHRLLNARSLVSQGTYEVTGVDCDSPPVTGLPYIDPFRYEMGWRDIVNDVRIDVTERQPDAGFSTVWESDDRFTLTTGQSVTIPVTAQEPFIDAQPITAAAGDIVYIGPGTAEVTLNATSGQSTSIRVAAVGGNVTVTYLRLRARSVPVARMVQVVQTDTTSIQKYGDRTYPDDVPFVSREDAEAVASVILDQYAERRPTVSVRLVSESLASHLQIVERTISDRVTIRNPEIFLDADFFIENIQHTLRRMTTVDDCPGPVHYATFGCEQAGDVIVTNPFTFDKPGAGFDDGFFGSGVADDPATLFIWDHPTQGQFDVGVFAT
jgi:hypothetical protein